MMELKRLSKYSVWCTGVISYTYIILITGTLSLSVTPPGDKVVAGRPFTLQCRITREAGNRDLVSWARYDDSGVNIYASRTCESHDGPAGFSTGCGRVGDEEVYSLTIENVRVEMETITWRCSRYTDTETLTDTVTLSVNVMVTSVALINPPVAVLAGNSATFTCVTSISKPDACVKWYIEQQGTDVRDITSGQPACNQPTTSAQTTSRTQTYTATATDNGAKLYCTATNRVTDPPVESRKDYTLTVHYPPSNVLSLTGYATGESVESGRRQPISLSCDVGEGNPTPTLLWSSACGNNRVPGNDGRQSISLTATPSLKGKSCVCQGNQAGSLTAWRQEKSVTFNITFGPASVTLIPNTTPSQNRVSVTENNTVTFTCTSGESNPAAIISIYIHNVLVSDMVSARPTTGDNSGYIVSGRYSVKPTRYQDGHVVRCEAQRLGRQDASVTSSALTLDVQYKPQIRCGKSQLKLFEGQHVILTCEIVSKPVSAISWTKGGTDVDEKYIIRGNLTSHLSTKIDIPSAEASDSGVFRITATNVLGSNHKDVMINVIEGQILPQEVQVINCRNGEAELIWPSGISKTEVEYFKLESRESQKEWEGILVRNPGQGKLAKKVLTGLQTGVEYEFRVQPNTDLAFSEFATTHCTVGDSGMSNLLSGSEITGAGIGVGFVAGGVCVLLCGVLVWIIRRRHFSSSKDGGSVVRSDRNELPPPPGEASLPTTGDVLGDYENMDTPEVVNKLLDMEYFDAYNNAQDPEDDKLIPQASQKKPVSEAGPCYDSLTGDNTGLTTANDQGGQTRVYQNTSVL